MTINKVWPVADIQLRIKVEVSRTGHQDRGEADTLVVEAAVAGVGHEHGHPVLALVAHNSNDGVRCPQKRFAFNASNGNE